MRQSLTDITLRACIWLRGRFSNDAGDTHVVSVIIVTGVLGAAALAGSTLFSDALKRAWEDLVGILSFR